MKEITSKDNRIIKEAASLSEKKYRDSLGLYLLEGPNLVREALREDVRLKFIFTLAGGETPEILQLARACEAAGPAVFTVSREAFARIALTDTPQGILAVAEKKKSSQEDLFARPGCNVLVMDRIQDPGNMGTMIRTADAAGFSGIVLMKGSADPFGPKVVRSAAGSLFRLPVMTGVSPDELRALLQKWGKTPYAAAMDGQCAYYEADLAQDIALVVGNEGNGVSGQLMALSRTISIPMAGRTESLNAALAAGIIIFESLRQKSLCNK